MHFVDRRKYTSAPIIDLALLHIKEQPLWLAYKQNDPKPSRPGNHWTKNTIREHIEKLFLCNCGYCGVYTTIGNDAEVDHHLPVHLDTEAMYIYDWYNYVWCCHPCNNKKSNNYPVLNPCSEREMEQIYFSSQTGLYETYNHASNYLKDLFNNTVEFTYMNGKNHPDRRKGIAIRLQVIFHKIITANRLLDIEYAIYHNDLNNKDCVNRERELQSAIDELVSVIKEKDYLRLIESRIEKQHKENPQYFPYHFEQLLSLAFPNF